MVILMAITPAYAADRTAYDFSFTTIDGAPLPLGAFKGKAVLVVNTASECGYTPQYQDLQALWQRYRDRGLVVLGVPSNDFGGQEPGTEAEIKRFCERQYSVDFPLTAKVHVTGGDAHSFYRWAAAVAGEAASPRWNFHKYLIGPDGELAAWFPTKTSPTAKDVTAAIEAALG
jgi:glutathione peroxidase